MTIGAYIIFFLSGASCLISEVAWNRMLVLLLGNTSAATSFIVMVFMAGLALGSYCAGHFLRKRQATIQPYIFCQIAIGFFILISPPIFNILIKNLFILSPSLNAYGLSHLTRFMAVAIYLIIPTFFMGATFPAIIHALSFEPSFHEANRPGYLYGINALGAALGCFCAGSLLLPHLGIRSTLACASLLSIVSAGAAFFLFLGRKGSGALEKTSHRNPFKINNGILKLPSLSYYSLTVFIIGFIAIAYQILMVRIIILLFGNQIEVFSFVVSAFLVATGVSAILSTLHLQHKQNLKPYFMTIIFVSAVFLPSSPILLSGLPTMGFSLILGRWGFQMMIWFIILLPQLFMASLLPTAIRMQGKEKGSGYTFPAGMLYALNTSGGIVAAATVNNYWVPFLGSQATLNIFATIVGGLGVLGLFKWKLSLRKRWGGIIVFLLLVTFINFLPEKIKGIYSSVLTNTDGTPSQVKLFHEGRATTITILDTKGDSRRLFLNGAEEVTSRFYHVQLFKTLGTLPILLHESDNPKDILIIAFGAGLSSGAALDTDPHNTITALDINPDINEINMLFSEINGNVYGNPRFEFIPTDGRNYVFLTSKKYPIIISDATHPFAYDSWILYTKEFYEGVKAHLTDNGIFAQWLPLTITDDFFKIFLKTFTSVFPNSTIWSIPGSDQAFILATPQPFYLDLNKLQNRLDKIPPSANLAYYGLDKATNLASFFTLDTPVIQKIIEREQRINSDNLSYNHRFLSKPSSEMPPLIALHPYQKDILPYVINASESQRERIQDLQKRSFLLHKYFHEGNKKILYHAAAQYPEDKLIQSYLGQIPPKYSWDTYNGDK